jgi:lambda family phage portal protein
MSAKSRHQRITKREVRALASALQKPSADGGAVPGGGDPVLRARGPGNGWFPYQASAWTSQELADWFPWIRSPDNEYTVHRDLMVARSRDLMRNDGWAAGSVMRILDNTVGAGMKLLAIPHYSALKLYGKGFDAKWAAEFGAAAEALYTEYSNDIGHWNDVARQLTVGQQQRLALRHQLIDGESLLVNYWRPDLVGYGGACYATSSLVVDPDLLSNPYDGVDTRHFRGGVEIDDDGVPVAYHIRRAHQSDFYNALESMQWVRVVAEDEDGWRRVIHTYERDRAGQHRGVGVFTPVLARMKMLARYYGVELQAATLQATLGLFMVSPFDHEMLASSVTGGDEDSLMHRYLDMRDGWRQENPALFNGTVIPVLSPGEDVKTVTAAHPHDAFEAFSAAMLRTMAAALGTSAEQVTQDWSKTNYSSARAALLEAWKTLVRRREEFIIGTAAPLYATWLREAFERRLLPLPRNAPDFVERATSYARCTFLGPGRGWIDPVKERQGSVLGMDAGLSTLQHEAAENSGRDWREILDQRAIEMAAFDERGLPRPSWAGMQDATKASEPPDEPVAA